METILYIRKDGKTRELPASDADHARLIACHDVLNCDCPAHGPNGFFVCTLPEGHKYPYHLARAGYWIVAMWKV